MCSSILTAVALEVGIGRSGSFIECSLPSPCSSGPSLQDIVREKIYTSHYMNVDGKNAISAAMLAAVTHNAVQQNFQKRTHSTGPSEAI